MPKLPPLTIGLVIDDSLDRPDGVQQYVLTVGEWLRRQGHDVHYLTSTTRRQDLINVHNLGENVPVRFNGNTLAVPLPASRPHIQQLMRDVSFDVLHVQLPYSPLLAGRVIAAAAAKTAIVGTFHIVPNSRLAAEAGRLLAWWSRPLLGAFDDVLSVSTAAQEYARHTFGLKSTVLPNAISLNLFRDAEPRPLTEDTETLDILFLGRLVRRKGCRLLLEAIVQLREREHVPRFHVTVGGRGPLALDLDRFVQSHHLQRLVTFKGYVPEADKPSFLASADITVFPSSGGESFGIVVTEAMAGGRSAVIAGDNAGYRSILEHCPGEVLFDPHNATDLADTLERLLRDAKLRQHIAAWQRQHAEQFDIAVVGPKLVRTYFAALRHRRNVR